MISSFFFSLNPLLQPSILSFFFVLSLFFSVIFLKWRLFFFFFMYATFISWNWGNQKCVAACLPFLETLDHNLSVNMHEISTAVATELLQQRLQIFTVPNLFKFLYSQVLLSSLQVCCCNCHP